jgi:transcriptional regulator with XRE-family HTH domain
MLAKHEEILLTIGEKLRELRQSRGLSMNIARDIRAHYGVKIDSSYLSRIERGKTEIPLRTLFALSDYFEVHPAYFLENVSAFKKANDIDYITLDQLLVQDLKQLKETVGEKKARQHLREHMNSILGMIQELLAPPSGPSGGLELRAARPTAEEEEEHPED